MVIRAKQKSVHESSFSLKSVSFLNYIFDSLCLKVMLFIVMNYIYFWSIFSILSGINIGNNKNNYCLSIPLQLVFIYYKL